MMVQGMQKAAGIVITHGLGNPEQVVVTGREDVRLLVIQVLDAVLHAAQEIVGFRQGLHFFGGHQARLFQPFEGSQGRPCAQFGKLPAAHHLQELHGEFDLADAPTRQLHVVRTTRLPGRPFGGVFAYLAMQGAQRLEHAVVEVAAEHKRQHHPAQGPGRAPPEGRTRRHHPAFEPGKPFPLAALDQKVFFQCP